ncbi:MAG: mitochondrial fission ELM1 family protein [Pseudomonadota bacterium]|nr:mitochondrial fission ELM1 family protein [Pseudomonadota bacterium]
MASAGEGRVVVWRICDGKTGHERQTHGLVRALGRLIPVEPHELEACSILSTIGDLFFRRFPWVQTLPDPHLIVGAGHATHLSLLAARRARGGRVVVLMRPSLPLAWFDLCIIPEHDGVFESPNVISTQGVLNEIQNSEKPRRDQGLFLIGGTSAHYHWDEEAVLMQVQAVVAACPSLRWQLTDSRRTPATTSRALTRLGARQVCVVPHADTDRGWLTEALAAAQAVWVTEDSVSMVYEALSSGAAVGLLRLPRRGSNRITAGIDALLRAGLITAYEAWARGAPLCAPTPPLAEAARCAQMIVERWGLGFPPRPVIGAP